MPWSHHAESLWQIKAYISPLVSLPLLLIKVQLNGPHPPTTLSHISSEGFVKDSLVGGLPLWLNEYTRFALLSAFKSCCGFLMTPPRCHMLPSFRLICIKEEFILFCSLDLFGNRWLFFSCFMDDIRDSNTTVRGQHVFWAMLVQCHDLSPSHI